MCSPLLNKYSSVILCVRVRSQREREREREREVAKKSMCGYSRKCLSLKYPIMSAQRRLFQFFFFSPTFRAQSGHVSDTPHKYSNREQESVSSTPQNSKQTRFSLSLSLSLRSKPKAKKEEGTDGVVFFALLLLFFRARRREFKTRLEKRKKKKREEGEDDDYSTECDDEGREQQRGGEKDIRLGPTLG